VTTTIDWYGCATFRLRTGGLTVFLDAYIDRAANAPGSGLTADDIDVCDWIVVGHSHFDHLFGAERIAANTGGRIIGSYETVRVMERGSSGRADDLRRRRRRSRSPTTYGS
jgi:L-ascorbate metabolism protein UlaG (beta-lactamase superfamily)